MRASWSVLVTLIVGTLAIGCSGNTADPPTTATSPSTPTGLSGQFVLQGDPESSAGAPWTYRGSVEGVTVDLQGTLVKPRGAGRWPAVIVSHGAGGNAAGYSRSIATEMVQWGLVCIATNYTHAGGVAAGAPGNASEPGASRANIIRARTAYEILRSLGYVDMTRVAAHGHSMGAFLTAALVGAYPADFRVASHTAGGVRTGGEGAAPTEAQTRTIRAPYQLHHGDIDTVVPLAMDQRLAAILQGAGIRLELHVYTGADHDDVSRSSLVLQRVRAWYAEHGMF